MQMLPGVSVRQQTPPPLPSRNTPAAQFSRLGEVHHRRDTSPQVNNDKVVQVASALTTCVGLHPSVLEGISRAGEKYRTIVTTASVP